jgi:hypothetical protein
MFCKPSKNAVADAVAAGIRDIVRASFQFKDEVFDLLRSP